MWTYVVARGLTGRSCTVCDVTKVREISPVLQNEQKTETWQTFFCQLCVVPNVLLRGSKHKSEKKTHIERRLIVPILLEEVAAGNTPAWIRAFGEQGPLTQGLWHRSHRRTAAGSHRKLLQRVKSLLCGEPFVMTRIPSIKTSNVSWQVNAATRQLCSKHVPLSLWKMTTEKQGRRRSRGVKEQLPWMKDAQQSSSYQK